MPKLSKEYEEILRSHGEDPKAALWDCHGTWVIYHRALERIAAKAGVQFPIEKTRILEADAQSKIATMIVVGVMGEREEWATGEAAPGNNKNSYPWAMAEKRAKDRVILKLVGLSGEIYSEEEADDFKPREPVSPRDGAGTVPSETQFDLIDRYGNVENVFPTAIGFITSLSTLVKDDGAWWQNNKETVTWIGKNSGDDKDLKKNARLLWKLGEEAAANVLEAG